jgi:hypothetical protein
MDIELELKNTQKRLNIVSSVLVDIAGQLAHTQPDYVNENIGFIMKAWSEAEDEYPMSAD